MKSIVLTGPESTGKTWLSSLLADEFQTSWCPEYLRIFYDKYQKLDAQSLKIVAERQIQLENDYLKSNQDLVFLDTNIITLKVYQEHYYHSKPPWFNTLYLPNRYSYYLLCDTSIPWVEDPQRDSPEAREKLYGDFKRNLDQLNVPYTIITGSYGQRLNQAREVVKEIMNKNSISA